MNNSSPISNLILPLKSFSPPDIFDRVESDLSLRETRLINDKNLLDHRLRVACTDYNILDKEFRHVKAGYGQLIIQNADKESELSELKDGLNCAKEEVDRLKADDELKTWECTALRLELTQLKANAEVEKAKAEVKKAKAEAEAAKVKAETAKAQVKAAKAEVEKAKAEAEAAKVAAETAKAEVKAAKAETEAAKAEAEAAKVAAETAKAEVKAAKAEAEAVKAEVAERSCRQKVEYDALLYAATKKYKAFDKRLAAMEEGIQTLSVDP